MKNPTNPAYDFIDWMRGITDLSEEDMQSFAEDFWKFTQEQEAAAHSSDAASSMPQDRGVSNGKL